MEILSERFLMNATDSEGLVASKLRRMNTDPIHEENSCVQELTLCLMMRSWNSETLVKNSTLASALVDSCLRKVDWLQSNFDSEADA